jgi:hypothetical protein
MRHVADKLISTVGVNLKITTDIQFDSLKVKKRHV